MIDLVKLQLIAGDGGNGRVSFHREKHITKGGPDGGYGGDGGDIIFVGDKHTATLKHLAGVTEITAENGGNGGKKKMHGANSEPVVIRVPVGTTLWVIAENEVARQRRAYLGVKRSFSKSEISFEKFVLPKEGAAMPERDDQENSEFSHVYNQEVLDPDFRLKNLNLKQINKEKLVEITEDGQEVVVCQGGFGGRGNISFKNSRNTTPLEAEYGTRGERRIVFAELKLLATVGLVGFPNAGKSTLIAKITRANPRVAAYPFTTLEPNLGIMTTQFGRELVVADIPGLVEGASEGKGLGFSFLRHIEACQVLLYVLSLDESIVFDTKRTNEQKAQVLVDQLEVLKRELNQYGSEILDKPSLVGVNKADLYDDELKAAIEKAFSEHKQQAVVFSGVTGDNLDDLSLAVEKFVV